MHGRLESPNRPSNAERNDLIAAHATYGQAVRVALSEAHVLLGDLEAAQIIESIYGALVACSQQVMLRMKAEDPEVGGVDHAFRATSFRR